MIREEGTDEQLKQCVVDACQPRVGEHWMEVTQIKTTSVRVGADLIPVDQRDEQRCITEIRDVFRVSRIEGDFIYTTSRIYERNVWNYCVRVGYLMIAPGRVLGMTERLVPA